MTVEPTMKDKQITIDVPEDRVAEFYAFYGQFLAGFPGRRRRGGPHRTGFAGTGGHRPHTGGHHCHPHHEDHEAGESAVPPEAAGPETTVV